MRKTHIQQHLETLFRLIQLSQIQKYYEAGICNSLSEVCSNCNA